MNEILRMLLGIGLFVVAFLLFSFLSSFQVLMLIVIGIAIALAVAGIQIFLDRKNLAKLDDIDDEES